MAGAEYDAVLLDVMLPKLDGYELRQRMRRNGVDTPVLLLTARDAISDRIKGLDLGADDYLVKPFDFEELLARIRVMTRKRTGTRSNCFVLADLTVDVQKRIVIRLRKKIDGDPPIKLLHTIRGVGWVLHEGGTTEKAGKANEKIVLKNLMIVCIGKG